MTSHELARELLSKPDVPVVLDVPGTYVEVCGSVYHEYTAPESEDEDDSEEGSYKSWNIAKLAYDEKRGSTISLI